MTCATRTLLLSQGYEPIKVISWQRAITLLTLGKVEVVEEYDANIRAVSLIIKVPAVVRLLRGFRRLAKPKLRRERRLVEGTGFEPVYAKRADLQSAGFNHSPTPPQRRKRRAGARRRAVYGELAGLCQLQISAFSGAAKQRDARLPQGCKGDTGRP